MSGVRRYGDLEINQDPEFQEKTWAWQRVAWLVIAAVLVSALLGLFGGGFFGRASVHDPGHLLSVGYDRFSRREASTTLEVDFRPDPRGVSQVWLSRDFVEGAGVGQVSPTPERELADSAGTTYILAAAPGERRVRVTFRLNPVRAGLLRARVLVGDGPELGFTQFVYP